MTRSWHLCLLTLGTIFWKRGRKTDEIHHPTVLAPILLMCEEIIHSWFEYSLKQEKKGILIASYTFGQSESCFANQQLFKTRVFNNSLPPITFLLFVMILNKLLALCSSWNVDSNEYHLSKSITDKLLVYMFARVHLYLTELRPATFFSHGQRFDSLTIQKQNCPEFGSTISHCQSLEVEYRQRNSDLIDVMLASV